MQKKQPPLDDAQTTVIQSLQDRLAKPTPEGPAERAPGTRKAIGIERAIDYATSSKRKRRKQPKHLELDLLRNAEFAAHRSANSEAQLLADIAALCAPSNQAFTGYLQTNLYLVPEGRQVRPGTHTSGPGAQAAGTTTVVQTTPEDEAIAGDLEDCLRTKVAKSLGRMASGVLDDMLLHKTVSETAARLGISNRTVDRTRREIRILAEPLLRPDSMVA